MLYIYLQKPDNVIEAVDSWFKSFKRKEWFNDPMVRYIISGIDKSTVVNDEYIESPVYGGMSPERLSTGCKAVITMWVQDDPVWATCCGNNCAKYIAEVSKKKDVHIWLVHTMRFGFDFDAVLPESGACIHTNSEYVMELFKLRQRRREELGYPD